MDSDRQKARAARAAARRRLLAGGVYSDGRPGPSAQLDTAEERLGTMWALARDTWILTGRSLPDYERADIPGRVLRDWELA